MKGTILSLYNVYSAFYIDIKNIFWKKFRKKYYNISIYKGYDFKMVGDGDITKWLYQLNHLTKHNKSFEALTIKMFLKHIKAGDTVLDIGANIGMFSLIASRAVGDTGRVYSFEPNENIYSLLSENIMNNECNNVDIFKVALSNNPGTLELRIPINQYGSDAFAYLLTEESTKPSATKVQKVEVKTLDQFIRDQKIGKVDLIKIDIEGAELLCLQGAINLLSSKEKPVILFECAEEFALERYNYTLYDLLSFLVQQGYNVNQFENWQWVAIPK